MYWRIAGEFNGNRIETVLPCGLETEMDVPKTYLSAREYLSECLGCNHPDNLNLKVSMVCCYEEDEKILRIKIDDTDNELRLYQRLYHEK